MPESDGPYIVNDKSATINGQNVDLEAVRAQYRKGAAKKAMARAENREA